MKVTKQITDRQALQQITAMLARMASSATRFPEDAKAQRERIKRAGEDYFYFCKTYFPHWFTHEFAPAHEQLVEEIKTPGQKIIQWPRGWAKTTHGAQFIPLWRAIFEKGNYSLIVGKNETHAREIVLGIILEVEANERLLQDFGDLTTDVWGFDSGFMFKNGRWISCTGWEGRVRGAKKGPYRPDYIVVDDIEDQEIVRNRQRVRRMIHWWLTDVMFAFGDGDGVAIWLCTNISGKSATSLLLDPRFRPFEGEEPPQFTRLKFSWKNADGSSAWPSRFPDERIRETEVRMGKRAAAQEMEGLAITDGGMFRREWMNFISESEVPRADIVWVGGCDPSVKDKDNADMKAVGCMGKHLPTGRFYVGYCWIRVGTDTEMCDAMYRAHDHKLHTPMVWWLEAQGAFELLKYPLAEAAKRHGNRRLPVRFFAQSLPKELRIRSMEAPFEQRLFYFIEGFTDQSVLIEQLEYFPSNGVHDDGPDMLEMCYRYLQHLTADRAEGSYESMGKRESAGLSKL